MSEHRESDADRPAGIVSRGIAALVDTAVVVAILVAVYLGIVLFRLAVQVREFAFPAVHVAFTTTGFIVVAILYLCACWAVSGRTAGSAVMGLRVTGHDGAQISAPVALARAVISVLFAIGLAYSAIDARRRSVADVVLRTRVVYSR
ncbi:hypothetical protein GOARA_056_01570 [Gordonia araii NBRC 100433]|uniref:RDD domain-containing protein n=1 Tax=Gordonia araii NBRC 100433 TaxID=1073574 RepID=G7H3I4_9ACTN|nr:RDD family protein [Gordonia araii]NNG96527.1 RDD family protein [Gordonia araii NBRC 100433]GAB10409.1 hypothetical protein GOARA_056_01570 [Gordonia araii NBRC 100433]